jgi:hypothetical protein
MGLISLLMCNGRYPQTKAIYNTIREFERKQLIEITNKKNGKLFYGSNIILRERGKSILRDIESEISKCTIIRTKERRILIS